MHGSRIFLVRDFTHHAEVFVGTFLASYEESDITIRATIGKWIRCLAQNNSQCTLRCSRGRVCEYWQRVPGACSGTAVAPEWACPAYETPLEP
jgi:hypothetical protein